MTIEDSNRSVIVERLLEAFQRAGLPLPAHNVTLTNGFADCVTLDMAYEERMIGIQVGGHDYDEPLAEYEAKRSMSKQGWCFHRVDSCDLEPFELEYVLATIKHCLYGRRERW